MQGSCERGRSAGVGEPYFEGESDGGVSVRGCIKLGRKGMRF